MRASSQAGQDLGTGIDCSSVTHIRTERGSLQYSIAGSASIVRDTVMRAMAPRGGCRPRTPGAERWMWHLGEGAGYKGCWGPYGTEPLLETPG